MSKASKMMANYFNQFVQFIFQKLPNEYSSLTEATPENQKSKHFYNSHNENNT